MLSRQSLNVTPKTTHMRKSVWIYCQSFRSALKLGAVGVLLTPPLSHFGFCNTEQHVIVQLLSPALT